MPSKKRASSPSRSNDAESKKASTVESKARSNQAANLHDSDDDQGEFEDRWEDEYESEELIENDEDEELDGEVAGAVAGMDLDAQQDQNTDRIPYIPQLGQGARDLEEDEELVPDLSTYTMLHHARLQWPCLSFDVLRDTEGAHRMKAPFNAYVVAGTQAAETEADANEVVVMKWENLTKTKRSQNGRFFPNFSVPMRDMLNFEENLQKDSDSEDDSDSDEDDDDAKANDDDAILTFRAIPHKGGVNRIRAQILPHQDLAAPPPQPPSPYHVATFSETGKVHIFDVAPHLASLANPAEYSAAGLSKSPAHTVSAHGRAEGFALAWNTPTGSILSNRLLSGDIHSKIHLSTLTPSGLAAPESAFTSHTSSVEDLQWSPSEATVFASCSADQSLRIWDIRVKERKSVLSVSKAHDSDVNVLSWNLMTNYLLLSGGDEGALKVWDLRHMKSAKSAKPTPVANFSWHSEPITSVEWHPTEDSCFAASSADHSVSLWDLSVELDDEEQADAPSKGDLKSADVPAQLLFVHQGQKDVKEIHWHPQIPGCVVSTAATGLDVFKTISL